MRTFPSGESASCKEGPKHPADPDARNESQPERRFLLQPAHLFIRSYGCHRNRAVPSKPLYDASGRDKPHLVEREPEARILKTAHHHQFRKFPTEQFPRVEMPVS